MVDSRKPLGCCVCGFCCCCSFKLNDYRSAFRWDGLDGTMIVDRPGHQEIMKMLVASQSDGGWKTGS